MEALLVPAVVMALGEATQLRGSLLLVPPREPPGSGGRALVGRDAAPPRSLRVWGCWQALKKIPFLLKRG